MSILIRPARIAAIVLRQMYLLRGSGPRIVQLFIWAFVDIIIWGFMTKYLDTVATSTHSFVPMLLGAVLLWEFLIRVMQGVSMSFMEDNWSRNHFNMFASPLSGAEYVCGLVASSIVTSIIALLAMIILAGAIFGLSMFSYGVAVFPFLLILFMTGIALGIFATGLMLRFGPAAEWLIWPIPYVISPFVGVFYPTTILPQWMQTVGDFLPPTYVFEGIRAIIEGQGITILNMLIGFGLAGCFILAASLFFANIHRYAVRTGLIARYSTESTN